MHLLVDSWGKVGFGKEKDNAANAIEKYYMDLLQSKNRISELYGDPKGPGNHVADYYHQLYPNYIIIVNGRRYY